MATHVNAPLNPAHLARDPRQGALVRGIALTMAALLAFAGMTGYFVWNGLASDVRNQGLEISTGTDTVAFPMDNFEGHAMNLLVIGTDQRNVAGYQFGDDSYTDGGSARSDTTMVAHISADRSRIEVVSIARDLMTTIPDCTRSDGTYVPGGWGQFNSAFSNGTGEVDDIPAGIACTKSTVEAMTGLTMDAFVVVNVGALTQMVDAIGGVWFDVPEAVDSPEADNLILQPGCQKFDGTTFARYARARHNYVEGTTWDGSDTMRMQRQQQLVAALLREVLSKNVFTDAPSLIQFVRQAVAALQLSPNIADLNTDVGLLRSIAGIDRANIRLTSMPAYPDPTDPNRMVANDAEATPLWAALAADQDFPIGTVYKDGFGNEQTIRDPAEVAAEQAAAQSAAAAEGAGQGGAGTTEPAPAPAQTTEPAATCPPAGS